jgi:NAD(P)-dependent dehydrogenase (short-subunit alcohol dehydrogenase family)
MSSPAQNRRVVVITGAAGGLGQGMVGEFVRQGWQVVAGCHQKPLALAGDQVLTLPLDVTNRPVW